MLEERRSKILNEINIKFLEPLNNSNNDKHADVPTALMIYGGSSDERKEIMDWLINHVTTLSKSFSFGDNEGDNLYRIQTEIDNAQNYYDKNARRTVLFINNFDSILNSNLNSAQTIGEMKELMSSVNNSKAPVTIVFQTDDISKINRAFTSNRTRIPAKVNIDALN